MNQIYIGYDSRAGIAYEVARKSIWKRTSSPLKIFPLRLAHLGMLTRPIEKRGNQLWCPISNAPMSTEFAISRFCVPFLQQSGWALFTDCDVLCWSDIDELFALADPRYAVMVVKQRLSSCFSDWVECKMSCGCSINVVKRVAKESVITCPKHDEPSTIIDVGDTPILVTHSINKMDGQIQTYYTRKNWSSVVLWNLDHVANKRFTLEMLNTLPGRDLHAFCWLNDYEIGELPQEWNHLINVTPSEPEKKGIWHFTLGGSWFPDWVPNKYDEEWIKESNPVEELCLAQ